MLRRAVLRVDDAVRRRIAQELLRARRPVRVLAYPGIAVGRNVRVRGRTLVVPTSPPTVDESARTWQTLAANLAHFVTFEVPHACVRVEVAGREAVTSTDSEGYLEVTLDDVSLPPGLHPVTVTPVAPEGRPSRGVVHALDENADVAVVSDIDDTILDSGIARGTLAAMTTALLRDPASRHPLDATADLFRALATASDGTSRPVCYLSTSPWNLSRFLAGFLDRHGFPPGPLALTDWGPGNRGLLRVDPHTHKIAVLRRLASDLQRPRFVLLGDTVEQDPEIYTSFAREHPGRVAAVYIRRIGAVSALRRRQLDECARQLQELHVPFLVADHSREMLAHAQEIGLVVSN